MTTGALAFGEEEVASGERIPGRAAFRGGGVQRADEGRERVEVGRGQVKGGHARRDPALADGAAQLLDRLGPHATRAGEFRAAVAAFGVGAVAVDAMLG